MDEIKVLNLGKDGVKDSFIAEARGILARHRKLKVRALKSALDGKNIKELAVDVSSKTNSLLLDVRGHTFVLKRK